MKLANQNREYHILPFTRLFPPLFRRKVSTLYTYPTLPHLAARRFSYLSTTTFGSSSSLSCVYPQGVFTVCRDTSSLGVALYRTQTAARVSKNIVTWTYHTTLLLDSWWYLQQQQYSSSSTVHTRCAEEEWVHALDTEPATHSPRVTQVRKSGGACCGSSVKARWRNPEESVKYAGKQTRANRAHSNVRGNKNCCYIPLCPEL